MRSRLFAMLFFATVSSEAQTVYSVVHDDWSLGSTWSSGQVPTNVDTIIVKHYITFNQNLTLQAPATLIIDTAGTLCGAYHLENTCGTRIFNYGEMYVYSANIRDMKNYKKFWSKNYITIYGCGISGYGTGYYNVPPNGTTYVWPDVPCKTKFTNWFGIDEAYNQLMKMIPNPITNKIVIPEEIECDKLILSDIAGKIILETTRKEFSVEELSPGIYFLSVCNASRRVMLKLVKV
jgi:hypothetical protein